MATSKELTGGTGDVNPQILTTTATQTGADVETQIEIPLPIPRYSSKPNRAIVLEALKVFWVWKNIPAVASSTQQAVLSTSGSEDLLVSTQTFAVTALDVNLATSVGFHIQDRVSSTDLTDGAGHGILIGTDSIFLTVASDLTTVVNIVTARLLYRYKEVSLTEYIGMVQSQS